MNKNWPIDARVDYKAPNSLINLIYFELGLEQELDDFENSFEWNE